MRAILFLIASVAFSQMFPGPGGNVTVTTTFNGPLDVGGLSTNVVSCISLRACSAALKGTNAINACNPTDAACADIPTDATTGNLVLTTIGGHDCTADDCTMKIGYDQTASGGCSGSCNVSQATIALRYTLKHNCANSTLWCLVGTAASNSYYAVGGIGFAWTQSFSLSAVAKHTNTAFAVLSGSSDGVVQLGFSASNTAYTSMGTTLSATGATDNVFNSLAALLNSTSSKISINGTSTTGDAGIAGNAQSHANSLSYAPGGFNLEGQGLEYILWSVDKSADFAALSTNQHSYWGF